MKYYKINVRNFYENDMIATDANGQDVEDAAYYFDKMREGDEIIDAPVFDYFYLQSFDKREYWEWMVADVHNFIGEGSQISGWLISKKLKTLLKEYYIPYPYFFYPSKLLYQGNKLEYYIFHFFGKKIIKQTLLYIDFSNTIFWNPTKQENIKVRNAEEFLLEYKRVYKENGSIDKGIQNKSLVLNKGFDFFPMSSFMKDNIISQKLKNAMEENDIQGFEFSELDYEVFIDDSNT